MGLVGKIQKKIASKAAGAIKEKIQQKISEKRSKAKEEVEEEMVVTGKVMPEIDWDVLKEEMEENVELEFNQVEKIIKLTFKKDLESYKIDKKDFKNFTSQEEFMKAQGKQVPLNMIYQMFKDKKQMKNMIRAYAGRTKPIKFDVNFDKNENTYLIHKFKEEEDAQKVYDLLNDIFFGNYLENLMTRGMPRIM